MTTQIELKGFRTINARLALWSRLTSILAKNPQHKGLSDVIEAILDQNKKLKMRLKELESQIDNHKPNLGENIERDEEDKSKD